MNGLDPLAFKYAVRWGTEAFTDADRRWLTGKRIMRISVTLGIDGSASIFLSNRPGPQETLLILGANETLCLQPDGAGLVSLVIDLIGGKWLIEAWEPQ